MNRSTNPNPDDSLLAAMSAVEQWQRQAGKDTPQSRRLALSAFFALLIAIAHELRMIVVLAIKMQETQEKIDGRLCQVEQAALRPGNADEQSPVTR